MRYLLLTLDAAGNWPPERVLIRALVERGHDVAVVSAETHRAQIETAGARYEAYRHADQRGPVTPDEAQGMDPLEFVARHMLMNPGHTRDLVESAERLQPDVLLVDQMLWSAAAAAESLPQPTAVLWHTVYGGYGGIRRVPPFMMDMLNETRSDFGLEPVGHMFEQAERADAILAFTLERFDEPPTPRPETLHYVGPLACLPEPVPDYRWPWPADDDRPLVLVSFSTSFMDQADALQRVADALAGLDVRGLLTVGPAMDPVQLTLADNVVAEAFVPHAAVLPESDLVVTHAGHGTTMAGVVAGVPLLCMPMGRDQFEVSALVEANGLGRSIGQDAPADELRELISAMVADPGQRDRSRVFAADIDLNAGLARAIEVLERQPAPR